MEILSKEEEQFVNSFKNLLHYQKERVMEILEKELGASIPEVTDLRDIYKDSDILNQFDEDELLNHVGNFYIINHFLRNDDFSDILSGLTYKDLKGYLSEKELNEIKIDVLNDIVKDIEK